MQYFFCLVILAIASSTYSQSETCRFVAQISLTAVERGAFLACTRSANPAACSIALAAHSCGKDPACSGVVKHFVNKGCSYTVKVVGNSLSIIGTAAKEQYQELKGTYDALNSVQGIQWIQRIMTGGH